MNIYYTFKYPDPFGILTEASALNFIYCLNLTIYARAIGQNRDHKGNTNFFELIILFHLGLCLNFTVMVPAQIFLAKRVKVKVLSFNDILETPHALKTFRVFTEKNLTSEQLDFYLEAAAFRASFGSQTTKVEVSRANRIYQKYIAVDAPDRINLSDSELSAVIKTFENNAIKVDQYVFNDLISGVYDNKT